MPYKYKKQLISTNWWGFVWVWLALIRPFLNTSCKGKKGHAFSCNTTLWHLSTSWVCFFLFFWNCFYLFLDYEMNGSPHSFFLREPLWVTTASQNHGMTIPVNQRNDYASKMHCWILRSQIGAATANTLSELSHVHCLAGSTADPLLDTHPKFSHCSKVYRLQWYHEFSFSTT